MKVLVCFPHKYDDCLLCSGMDATNLLFLDEDNNTFFNQKLDKANDEDYKVRNNS